ncbi:peptide-N4-(N-acetyl-beta-D-glucosaminyl) asparaginase amidase N [Aureobasidium pullulans]|uniref:Peptide-N4-(N-acetyl-beta-D-glucosaminyl) asparaginase amidase N n=1 Tax=Aureobasidium pullulans TaxID=5580 RepID=A0A4S9IBN0_AURPU|nr:peptide-N4-(N-acetyl-beta-D-glucosaminyl) asparaginase amidase N [Aureobasidium pullulans]THZ69013.1 peptide-N4-(N-acetyl-beta-D-glucosaminyl) asparaginase amidase N [Aureobasidium pullulans]
MHLQRFVLLASALHAVSAHRQPPKKPLEAASLFQSAAAPASPLPIIQLYKPVPIPKSPQCNVQQTLMVHTFASSYGVPYVGQYTPPDCDFNNVVIEWTVTSAGRQFDRLAEMYLGDIEVWRTSTAEPTASGIIFRYEKDLSMYLSLWKSPQKLIFELDNVYDSTYTGAFNTTLTATFSYNSAKPAHADLILPITPQLGASGQRSIFTLPGDSATVQQTFPRNISHATVSIAATGQSNEEFWYTNALQSDIHTFESTVGTLLGYGPFREVQLFIDDMMAGVAWPFPIIFTGGIAPGFWRPVVGIDAYDLREYEIDITPFLPYLLDGKPHAFSIRVVGMDDNEGNGPATLSEASINSYWLVSGKIFLFYGDESYNGTHAAPTISTSPVVQTTSNIGTTNNGINSTNSTLSYSVTAKRTYSAKSSFGSWTQSLDYSNTGFLGQGGLASSNIQKTAGTSAAVVNSAPDFSNTLSYTYPIIANTTYASANFSIFDAYVDYGLKISSSGRPDVSTYSLVSGPMNLDERQFGEAYYSSVPNSSYSFGIMDRKFQEVSYGTPYSRHVKTNNLTITYDSVA